MHSLDINDQLFEQLKALQPLKPEDQARLDKKFRLEFNYNSNHIEGNTLTYGETELLLIFDDTKGGHSMREYEEMKAHDVAWHMVETWAKDRERPLTEADIRSINELILVRPYWKEAITPDGQTTRRLIKVGSYKDQPNSVRLQNGELFHYASPAETPALMAELMEWYRDEEGAVHPVTLAAMLHYKFVRIHPFDDGNGRTARLLMNYVLLREGYPPVIIKSADKDEYRRALHMADVGDYAPFIAYISDELVWSLELAVKAAKGEPIDEANDWEKRLYLLRTRTEDLTKVKEPQSVASLHKLGTHFIIPLIRKMMKKYAQMEDMFVGKNVFAITDQAAVEIKTGDELIAHFSETADRPLSKLEFNYQLQGYKRDGINTFQVATGVKWDFEAYRYRMQVNHYFQNTGPDEKLFHLYHEEFSEADIDAIVATCGTSLVQQIETQIKGGKDE